MMLTRAGPPNALVRAAIHATLAVSIALLSLAAATMAQSPARDSGLLASRFSSRDGLSARITDDATHRGPSMVRRKDTGRIRLGDGGQGDTVVSHGQVLVFNPSGRWSRSTHVGIGAVAGLLLGTAVFAAAAVQSSPSHCAAQNGVPCALGLQVIAVPLIGGGAVLGGVIGALLPAARWERVVP